MGHGGCLLSLAAVFPHPDEPRRHRVAPLAAVDGAPTGGALAGSGSGGTQSAGDWNDACDGVGLNRPVRPRLHRGLRPLTALAELEHVAVRIAKHGDVAPWVFEHVGFELHAAGLERLE